MVDLNREPMPRQDSKRRRRNFGEVALGYGDEQALLEAKRCIQCPKQPCITGCPVVIDIPGFIDAILKKDMPAAARILKEKNSLPAICGRVCPQESQCEAVCTLAKKGTPIAIGRLERHVADWERKNKPGIPHTDPPALGQKGVAVVGSGPAGLTTAADLAKLGYRVTIFEGLHEPGGVLMYGIPEFRLPKEIVRAEVDYVLSLGVKLQLDSLVGKLFTIDELLTSGYDAVFLGTGAGLPMFLNIPGENLNGIYSANEFLTRINLMKAYLFPEYDTPVKMGKRVAVIGGGNVAMDSARCAVRLGSDEVYIVYRRSKQEMPARREEVENAMEEGIQFRFLTNPKRIIGNEKNWVTGMECLEMELGEPDASGRRRPIVKPGTEFMMEVDEVVVALGTTPNPLIASTTPDLETTKYGTVVANGETGRTVKDRVWAGGDVMTGSDTVISAMGAGKRAATDINEYLKG
ncbi:MAG: NADPH-dependent glutamate synthase [Dehalococcoidia bacterium]|nr:MAG: NADPH-dependent glutamate synthase [Dehalococcoidia bacterium]